VNTLLFSEHDQACTSLPDLACDLKQVHGIDVSKEAIHKKFTPEAVVFLKKVLNNLLSERLQLSAGRGLPQHFPRIKIKDSTRFSLPDCYNDAYKGYTNFSKKMG
jgi:hypothetical protein